MKYAVRITWKILTWLFPLLIVIGILLNQTSVWSYLFLVGEIFLVIMERILRSKNLLPTYTNSCGPTPNEKQIKQFIEVLDEAIAFANEEKSNLEIDMDSSWDRDRFVKLSLKELSELYEYAQKGIILYKYGPNNRKLDSVVFAKKNGINLSESSLGRQLIKLDRMYRSM